MKKIFLFFNASIAPILASIPLLSCTKKQPDIVYHTIKYTSSDCIELKGVLEKKIPDKSKWKEAYKPSIMHDYGIKEVGWYNGEKPLEDDYEITSDLQVKFIAYDPKEVVVNVTIITAQDTYKDNKFIKTAEWKDFKAHYKINEDPKKEGHKFIGWFDKDTNKKIEDTFKLEKDNITIEARFIDEKKTISFDKSEGVTFSPTNPPSLKVEPNTLWKDVNKPSVQVDELQYKALGWYDKNSQDKLTDDYKITKDINAYYCAISNSVKQLKITLNYDNGQQPKQLDYYQDKKATWGEFLNYWHITNPSKEGYTFEGWYHNEIKLSDNFILPDVESFDVKAKYTINEYKVSFEVEKGASFKEQVQPINVKYGTKWKDISKPEVNLEKGYEGLGWYINPLGKLEDETIIKNNMVAIYKTKDISKLEVSVQLKNGDKSDTYLFIRGKSFKEFKTQYSIKDPEYSQATFDGWYYDNQKINDDWTFPIDKSFVTLEAKSYNKFENDSWETLIENAKGGLAGLQKTYGFQDFVGLKRVVEINGYDYIVRVIGQGHDQLADGSGQAALTFELQTLLSDYSGKAITSKWDKENNKDYTNSILRANLNGGESQTWITSALEMLPEQLQSGIKTVKKKVATGSKYSLTTYEDKLFVLTYRELGFSQSQKAAAEGTTYKYWSNKKSKADRLKKDICGTYSKYWMASPYLWSDNYSWNMANESLLVNEVNQSYGVSFAFCI